MTRRTIGSKKLIGSLRYPGSKEAWSYFSQNRTQAA
jgi:hypothetical protein